MFATFVGMVTPPLLIAGALKLGAAETAYLVSMSLFVSDAATILQTRQIGPVGSGLLSIQGTSFTFIAPVISAAGIVMASGASPQRALGVVFGLCFAGEFVVMLASRFIRYASAVITPIVTGTVVTLIGLTLIEVGMVSVGGGYGANTMGYDRCRHVRKAPCKPWIHHPRLGVHPVHRSSGDNHARSRQAAALVRVLRPIRERPSDLPLFWDLRPNVLSLEAAVRSL